MSNQIVYTRKKEYLTLEELYKTTCPHCHQEITIPEETLFWRFRSQLGKLGAKKRNVSKEYLRQIALKRWENTPRTLHPVQQGILTLAHETDIDSMPRRTLAERLKVDGPHAATYISYHISQLRKKGLLPTHQQAKVTRYTLRPAPGRAYYQLSKEIERLRQSGVAMISLSIPEAIQREIMSAMVDAPEITNSPVHMLSSFAGVPVSLSTSQDIEIVYDENACHTDNQPLVTTL